MNSQPPPSAMPSTAETVGTIAYFHACVVAWNCATTPSTFSSRPAISASATLSLRAAFSTMDSASRRKPFIILREAGGLLVGLRPGGRPLQVRPERERRLGLPDDQALEAALPFVDRLQDAVEHVLADRVHLALEADHADVVAGGPHAHRVGLEDGLAVLAALSHQTIRERLAPIHRQRRPRPVAHSQPGCTSPPACARRYGPSPAPRPEAAPAPCCGRRRCLPGSTRPRAPSRPPARSRTGPGSSRSPSAPPDRGRARCRRSRPGGTRSSAACRGTQPTGTSPADARSRAASGSARRCRGS